MTRVVVTIEDCAGVLSVKVVCEKRGFVNDRETEAAARVDQYNRTILGLRPVRYGIPSIDKEGT